MALTIVVPRSSLAPRRAIASGSSAAAPGRVTAAATAWPAGPVVPDLVAPAPMNRGQELAFGYGAQLVLSYFIAGGVKILNPDCARAAPCGTCSFLDFPVAEDLRRWADRPRVLAMSWAVILFELAFPLTLLSRDQARP